jgi:hypothetical protein
MDQEFPPWPPAAWKEAIGSLNKKNAMLGPTNGAFKALAPKPGVAQAAEELIAALLGPGDGSESKTALDKLRNACRDEANRKALPAVAKSMDLTVEKLPGWAGPSKLAGTTYNDLLEPVNAKRIWQLKQGELYPWPFNEAAKKPDYRLTSAVPGDKVTAVQYYDDAKTVGDQIKVGSSASLEELVEGFTSSVSSKSATYPGKKLWVVVDLVDNPYLYQKGVTVAAVADKLNSALKLTVGKLPGRKDLIKVSAVFEHEVRTFTPDDWA